MLKIYGTMLCKDCVSCVELFPKAGIEFEFCDFKDDLNYLKEFLKLRDNSPLFNEAKTNGGIGIPCIVREDGSITLDWVSFLPEELKPIEEE